MQGKLATSSDIGRYTANNKKKRHEKNGNDTKIEKLLTDEHRNQFMDENLSQQT